MENKQIRSKRSVPITAVLSFKNGVKVSEEEFDVMIITEAQVDRFMKPFIECILNREKAL